MPGLRLPSGADLARASKALLMVAAAGFLLGAVSCGLAPELGLGEAALFGFYALLASAALAYVAANLRVLALAAEPSAVPVARALLLLGALLGILAALPFALLPVLPGSLDVVTALFGMGSRPAFLGWVPRVGGAGVALVLAGLLARALMRRGAS